VILNDNTWSISRNVGAISTYMTSIMADNRINQLRDEIWEFTGRFKRRDKIRSMVSKIEDSVKGLVVPGMLFEKLGFRYFGPIDGHDLPLLVKTLQNLKQIHGPVMLHIATKKGKGYEPAEGDPYKYHGVGKFDKITGKLAPKSDGLPAYTKVFGDTMVELGEKNDKVIAITAAMSQGTGLDPFGQKFPERFFDVGIAEAHAGCFASGLAADGMKPYLTIYSTFLQRAYDQVIHDIGIHNLPVVLCMDRAGLVGEDGPTHHGVFDIAYLSTVPGYTVCAPKDGNELRSMLHYTADTELDGPVAIRYPRENTPTEMTSTVAPIEWGRWETVTPLTDIVLLAVGTMVQIGLTAAEKLKEQGIALTVINARFIKPLDIELLEQVRQNSRIIVTAEEASVRGGFGHAVADYLLTNGYTGKFTAMGVPDTFITHGARPFLMRDAGLDVDAVVAMFESLTLSKPKNGLLQRLMFRRSAPIRRVEQIRKVG
jgi:1-deoxy-D-xylulose-5-phosphate synthase